MRLEFLGTGTSFGVPQIGCDCEVCTSTNAKDKRCRCSIWVQHGSLSIVVDTGPDFRTQCLRSRISHLDAVIYTHFHADHIFGLDDVRAFNYLQDKAIPVYLPEFMIARFRQCFQYTLVKPSPGLTRPRFRLIAVTDRIDDFDSLSITPVDIYHGEERVKGYIFQNSASRIAYLTDCKALPDETISKVCGADVVIISALWSLPKTHPGHMNLDEALDLAEQLQGKITYLTHITHKMGRHDDTEKRLPSHIRLAYDRLSITV